jgi:hypothetical protein
MFSKQKSSGMEAIKFFNLSPAPLDRIFLEFLVGLLKSKDIESIVETLPSAGDWHQLKKKLTGSRAALLDLVDSQELVDQMPALPAEINLLSCADCLFYEGGEWWPRLNLKEAIRELIVKKARSLDIKESAYIIGQGPMLRLLGSLVVSFGFSKIYLVGLSIEDLNEQRDRLKKNFVGIDWRPLEATQLTMQTVNATLLINSISLSENPGLMSDLAYFNFMKKQGLVVDLDVLPLESVLLEEAKGANLRVLSGFEVRAQQDFGFMQRLGLSSLITFDEFSGRWLEYLKSVQ